MVTNNFVASFSSGLQAFLHDAYRDENLVAHTALFVVVEVYLLRGIVIIGETSHFLGSLLKESNAT